MECIRVAVRSSRVLTVLIVSGEDDLDVVELSRDPVLDRDRDVDLERRLDRLRRRRLDFLDLWYRDLLWWLSLLDFASRRSVLLVSHRSVLIAPATGVSQLSISRVTTTGVIGTFASSARWCPMIASLAKVASGLSGVMAGVIDDLDLIVDSVRGDTVIMFQLAPCLRHLQSVLHLSNFASLAALYPFAVVLSHELG